MFSKISQGRGVDPVRLIAVVSRVQVPLQNLGLGEPARQIGSQDGAAHSANRFGPGGIFQRQERVLDELLGQRRRAGAAQNRTQRRAPVVSGVGPERGILKRKRRLGEDRQAVRGGGRDLQPAAIDRGRVQRFVDQHLPASIEEPRRRQLEVRRRSKAQLVTLDGGQPGRHLAEQQRAGHGAQAHRQPECAQERQDQCARPGRRARACPPPAEDKRGDEHGGILPSGDACHTHATSVPALVCAGDGRQSRALDPPNPQRQSRPEILPGRVLAP